MRNIRVYLVLVDIRIVNCRMYPGEPCPPSLVLLYMPAEASMQYNPLYTNSITLHYILPSYLSGNPKYEQLKNHLIYSSWVCAKVL